MVATGLVILPRPAAAVPAGPMVAAGRYHTCVIRSSLFSGAPACWGVNLHGELGDGTSTASGTPVAVDTSGVLSGLTLVQIAASGEHTCVLSSAGQAYCWGDNGNGELGDGTTTDRYLPVAVDASGALTGVTLTRLALGNEHTCALSSTGDAYCWGYNVYGELGDGSTTTRHTPVLVSGGLTFTDVGAGLYDTCGVASGHAYCWGYNLDGGVGDGTTTTRHVPTAVDTSGVLNGVTVVAVRHGEDHGCALSAAGAAYCWGAGTNGNLGDGLSSDSSSPVAVSTSGALNGVTLTGIATGISHTCGVSTAGAVYCWGDNTAGEIGDGTNTDRAAPVPVDTSAALHGQLAVSVSANGVFTCVSTRLHGVYCWGHNAYGQLGDGTNTNRSTPVEAIAADTLPASPTGVHVVPGDGTATVSWTAPGSMGNGSFTRYTVVAAPGGRTCTTTGTSCTVTGLSGGTRYTFSVTTSTTVGTSDPSASATATPAGLATTGRDLVSYVETGCGLLGTGAVLVFLARRRRPVPGAPGRR